MVQEPVQGALDLTVAPSEHDPRTQREPYDPAKDRERVRGRLAQWLLLLLAAVIAVVLGGLLAGRFSIEDVVKLAAVVLSPLVGLLGAVVGFYYGEQSRRR